jgi:hypothetical protein
MSKKPATADLSFLEELFFGINGYLRIVMADRRKSFLYEAFLICHNHTCFFPIRKRFNTV